MNQISHKQAIKLIHRRLDGLLTKRQLLLLGEHLRSCTACTAYAAEVDLLPTQLQNEFHARWDEKPGPSQKIMEHVTTKARKIPMTNRISFGVKLFAGAATLILLAFAIKFVVSQLRDTFLTATGTETVNNLPQAGDRLLAFTSDQNGNYDIYTIHADGSELTNLTNDPAQDVNPFWSPDGKYIAFESDRSGISQIYLMDADGSNVVQLTTDEAAHYLPMNIDGISYPWSPDGSKILFLQNNPGQETWTLISQNIKGGDRTSLVAGQLYYNGISWSPDGNYIGYILDSSPNPVLNPVIYVTNANGSETGDLKELVPQNEVLDSRYRWSADAESIIFTTARHDPPRGTVETVVYEYNLGSNTLLQDNFKKMTDWEESTYLVTEFRSFESSGLISVRQYPDGKGNTFDVDAQCLEQNIRSSPRGNFAIGAYCPDNQFRLYWVNSEGSTTKQLFASPVDVERIGDIVWSPDDRYLAFNVTSSDGTNWYVLDVEKALSDPSTQPVQVSVSSGEFYWIPSWRLVVNNEVVDEKPTSVATPQSSSQADNRLLAFTAVIENHNFDIYTMRPDGSELTNLTNNPAHDANPFWSPNGKRIAFESERTGFTQIFVMDANGSNVFQVTDGEVQRQFSNSNPWSPDGSRLIFTEWAPENEKWMLYAIGVDEQNKTPLAEVPNIYTNPSWSPDGEHIAFVLPKGQGDREVLRIHVVDANGDNLTDITKLLPADEGVNSSRYTWSEDGGSISFITHGLLEERWTAYEASLDGETLTEKAELGSPMSGVQAGTIFMTEVGTSALTLNCQETNGSDTSFVTKRLVGDDSLMINLHCPSDELWFYLADPDGKTIKQVLGPPISAKDGGVNGIFWSPDDKYIAVTVDSSGVSYLYVIDVEESVKRNAWLKLQHLQMTLYGGVWYFNVSWQPVP